MGLFVVVAAVLVGGWVGRLVGFLLIKQRNRYFTPGPFILLLLLFCQKWWWRHHRFPHRIKTNNDKVVFFCRRRYFAFLQYTQKLLKEGTRHSEKAKRVLVDCQRTWE